ncbi:ABC transporter permease [Peristeroidobacter soli]|uniref:ABC transporter permease n=1 Tax=Peristeroidobacter soli TaxID=2497877 RepID=UPI00101CA7E0|nr:ABC transporter permease [Peristeroidobacter soli]
MSDSTNTVALTAHNQTTPSFYSFERISSVLYPTITLAALLIIWQTSVAYFNVPQYIFPSLTDVLRELWVGFVDGGTLYPHLAYTLKSALTGYLLGCGAAIVVGALLAESRAFEKFVYPLIIGLQSTPKIAIAPLLMVWLGYGLSSKIAMVAMMCFFPLFVNTVQGIRQTDPALLNMMRAFSAPTWLTFFRVKMFAATSNIFAGLQITIVFAFIGAIVSEFLGSSEGLGYLIQSAMANFNTPVMFAAIVTLIALSLIGTAFVQWVHRKVAFWDRTMRNKGR